MTFRSRSIACTVVLLALPAGAAKAAPTPPDLTRITGTPAPSRGKIYADCLAQAAGAGAYDRTADKDTHLLRFKCFGVPAKAFYDELAVWSTAHHSEWAADGRTWRSTGKIVHSLFGTDYCSTDGASDFQCEITVNVGNFLDG